MKPCDLLLERASDRRYIRRLQQWRLWNIIAHRDPDYKVTREKQGSFALWFRGEIIRLASPWEPD